jgi:hypothetical protein
MNIVTRTYYIPRNQIGRYVMNYIVEKVGCSVGEFKLNRQAETIRFSITCKINDVPTIEKILRLYDMLGE